MLTTRSSAEAWPQVKVEFKKALALRSVQRAYDLPLPSLIDEAVAHPKLHREDPASGGLRWLALLLGPSLSHRLGLSVGVIAREAPMQHTRAALTLDE